MGLSRPGVPKSCLEEHTTGCNTAQQRTTTALEETKAEQVKHPTRRHDAFSLEALPKLNTRVRFPSSALKKHLVRGCFRRVVFGCHALVVPRPLVKSGRYRRFG
jgi:hypothetical protein